MRNARLLLAAAPLFFLSVPGSAQDRGVAVNMGRGLDNGGSVNWTFKENWTLRPTIGATYSQQGGFRASLGSTILRSVGIGGRVYAYVGAGVYYGSANTGVRSTLGGTQTVGGTRGNQIDNGAFYQNAPNIAYVTTPFGLRGRLFGNVEAFAEAAFQRTLSGQFGPTQTGQFSGNGDQRFGATFGISLRLQ